MLQGIYPQIPFFLQSKPPSSHHKGTIKETGPNIVRLPECISECCADDRHSGILRLSSFSHKLGKKANHKYLFCHVKSCKNLKTKLRVQVHLLKEPTGEKRTSPSNHKCCRRERLIHEFMTVVDCLKCKTTRLSQFL